MMSPNTADERPKLEAVELFRADLRLRAPVGTANGVHDPRPVAFVRVVTAEAEGWGECAALGHGTTVDAAFADVWELLGAVGVPRLIAAAAARDGRLPPAGLVAGMYASGSAPHLVAATMEMAVLDAELRAAGEPLWRRLGAGDDAARLGAPVGRLVGIPAERSIDALVAAVGDAAPRSARVRVKIEPGWDIEPVRALRAAFPVLDLQVDANGSYRLGGEGLDDAARLGRLDEYGLACVEQPLPPRDLTALAELARRLETPVALDESLTSLGRLRDALRYGACEVACIKPARLGGILRGRAAAERCLAAGVDAFVGGFFETGLARTANAALALHRGFTLPGDLSGPCEYLEAGAPDDPGSGGGARALPFGGAGVGAVPTLGSPLRRFEVTGQVDAL